jgi:adenine deaminase
MKKISGKLVDVFRMGIYPAEITFDSKIRSIKRTKTADNVYITPGFIDAHIHVESSMLIPSEFARLAVRHGTVGVVSDPHEIANVLGIKGIEFMIRNSKKVPLKFYFGASSCVPATPFETSGAHIKPDGIEKLLKRKEILYLSEVMNYPGVINRDPEVMEKIAIAKRYRKRIDGHAPGLMGKDLDKYLSAGIETDHECYLLEEAREKQRKGMKIIVREGSAAKNLSVLHPIMASGDCMLCSDDRHPDDLLEGHVDSILKKCVSLGVDPLIAIKSATRNAVEHYGLDIGLLREEDPADFLIVKDLKSFKVIKTWIMGNEIYDGHSVKFHSVFEKPVNKMKTKLKKPEDFRAPDHAKLVIGAIEGSLITDKLNAPKTKVPDVKKDVLKITVVNRYTNAKPAVGFIKNFGMKKGAFGASVMHDSHNICVIGADEESICKVVNAIIEADGGLAVHDGKRTDVLRLHYAGLMSDEDGVHVTKKYETLTKMAKRMGCKLRAPFMTLSFMALLVIPHLKMSDKGLFDADKFEFVEK